jgi:hypothetical protein
MSTGTLSAGVKWQGHEADHSLLFRVEVKNGAIISPLSIHLHCSSYRNFGEGTKK